MNEIRMYIKDRKGQNSGILIGFKTASGRVIISGSNARSKVDTFKRDVGVEIARSRIGYNPGAKGYTPTSGLSGGVLPKGGSGVSI